MLRSVIVHQGSGRDEGGFSLVELLIVLVILPIVVAGIAAALIAILKNETTTFNRVADSADAQLTSANFARDVQSATLVSTSSSLSPPRGQCWPAASSPPPGSTPLLGLQWGQTVTRTFVDGQLFGNNNIQSAGQANFTAADVNSIVTDSDGLLPTANPTHIQTVTSSQTATMFAQATGSATNDHITLRVDRSWVVTYWDVPVISGSTTTYELIRQFCQQSGAGPAFVSTAIVAHDLPANQGPASVTCGPSVPSSQCTPAYIANNWLPTSGVTNISLSAVEPASGYQFNLAAAPRGSSSGSEAVTALLLTGSGPSLSDLNSGDSLTVNGELDFNSSSGSVGGPGNASARLALNPVPGQPTIAEYQCNASCGAVTSSFNGVVTCNGGPSCPPVTSLASQVPLPAVPAPASPTSSGPTQACTNGPNFQPGYYGCALTVSGNATFASGNYTFAGAVTINGVSSSNTSISFGSGQYTFGGGLKVAPAGTSNITLTGSGVFFYLQNGSLSVNTQGASINLTPATTGQYAGILIDQPASNVSPLSFMSGGKIDQLGGVVEVEAPTATVTLGSNGDTFNLGTLVAGALTLGSTNVKVTVGS